ncbi:Ada metal-binding domain-containing protein [Nonomuraea sp. NPDC005501]|uniref:Ada metal-binding domain-containing protein n=1 Tax=Nonomuraea sp. NPDC005501 TaxID=3156884 RepID=UPI0033A0FAE5
MNAVGAVLTTGIYCRDDCPGRPLPANTTRYPSAAAAEAAGYRACHRCRPYRQESLPSADMPRASYGPGDGSPTASRPTAGWPSG